MRRRVSEQEATFEVGGVYRIAWRATRAGRHTLLALCNGELLKCSLPVEVPATRTCGETVLFLAPHLRVSCTPPAHRCTPTALPARRVCSRSPPTAACFRRPGLSSRREALLFLTSHSPPSPIALRPQPGTRPPPPRALRPSRSPPGSCGCATRAATRRICSTRVASPSAATASPLPLTCTCGRPSIGLTSIGLDCAGLSWTAPDIAPEIAPEVAPEVALEIVPDIALEIALDIALEIALDCAGRPWTAT